MKGNMMYEDKSSMANLPQEKKMKYYPKGSYMGGDLDDTIKGIDGTHSNNMSKVKNQKSKTKY